MTPFGIRKRLAHALLGPPAEKIEESTFPITFVLPDGVSHVVEARTRYTLSMASQVLETPIDTPCNEGECGACAVQVLRGEGLTPAGDAERALMANHPRGLKFKPDERLACFARVEGPGAEILVKRVWTLAGTA